MDKVIFLDVDGVLNDSGTPDRAPGGFIGISKEKVGFLKRIATETGAAIVLTSTWKSEWNRDPNERTLDGKYLNDMLKAQGLVITDKTEDRISDRGHGILRWLSAHPEVKSWIALDDDIFYDYKECGILPHLVKSTWHYPGGLNDELADRAIQLLTEAGCA